jgi:hypothetical protein
MRSDNLERATKAQESAAARQAEFEAAHAALLAQPDPDDFDAAISLRERCAAAKARLDLARERREAADAVLAKAKEEARRSALIAERERLNRDGDKHAASWAARWSKASAELVSILEDIEADDRACRALSEQLFEIGEGGIWSAVERFRRARGIEHSDLGGETVLPSFDGSRARHWPRRWL